MAMEVKQVGGRERGMFSALICILPVLLMHTANAHPMWQQSNKREEKQRSSTGKKKYYSTPYGWALLGKSLRMI